MPVQLVNSNIDTKNIVFESNLKSDQPRIVRIILSGRPILGNEKLEVRSLFLTKTQKITKNSKKESEELSFKFILLCVLRAFVREFKILGFSFVVVESDLKSNGCTN